MVVSPLTGSADVTLLETIPAAQLICDWQQIYRIDITNELHGHPEIQMYLCNQSGLRFFYPFDTAGSGQLYAQLQQFDWYYMPDKWEHQVARNDLAGSSKILEVGCGSGHFINSSRQRGLNIQGIELNETAVREAQSRGLPVERLDLAEAAQKYAGTFDAVCNFQVLEHVPNPGEFLRWSLQLLKPGGKLICCVPNGESFIQHEYNLLNLPPHHMLYWSETSFRALEKFFPVKTGHIVFEPLTDYHVVLYLKAYGGHYRKTAWWGKLAFNRFLMPLYGMALRAGLRKCFRGQSIYVQFTKVA